MAKRTCIFCGALGPLTQEHVIPIWIQRYVGGKEDGEKTGTFRGTHMSWAGTMLSKRTASGNSHTLGTVCGPCNNGWMARLESDFAKLLPRLRVDMSPKRFSKAERRTIALWVVKSGIIAHRSSNYRSILPDSLPRSLGPGTSIPAGIRVYGGLVKPEKTICWVQGNIRMNLLRKAEHMDFDVSKQTFVFVLSIVDIYLGFGWHGLNHSDFELFLATDDSHQIYPHPKSAQALNELENLALATVNMGLRHRS